MEDNILRNIGTIARALDSISNVEFKDISLEKGQYLYLSRIVENPGITQGNLSQMLCVDKTTTNRAVSRLVEKKLIIKKSDTENQKNRLLWANEKGKLLYQTLEKERRYSTQVALEGISDVDAKKAEKIIYLINENITKNWLFVKKGNKRHY